MGTCESHPKNFTVKDLSGLALGEKMNSGGCGAVGPANEGTLKKKGFFFPGTGEFEYGGEGPACNMCSFQYGCSCSKPGQHIPGRQGTIKRVAFKGSMVDCCKLSKPASGNNVVGNTTCDPKYYEGSSACKTAHTVPSSIKNVTGSVTADGLAQHIYDINHKCAYADPNNLNMEACEDLKQSCTAAKSSCEACKNQAVAAALEKYGTAATKEGFWGNDNLLLFLIIAVVVYMWYRGRV